MAEYGMTPYATATTADGLYVGNDALDDFEQWLKDNGDRPPNGQEVVLETRMQTTIIRTDEGCKVNTTVRFDWPKDDPRASFMLVHAAFQSGLLDKKTLWALMNNGENYPAISAFLLADYYMQRAYRERCRRIMKGYRSYLVPWRWLRAFHSFFFGDQRT